MITMRMRRLILCVFFLSFFSHVHPVSNPWAHIVKFGQPKAQVVAPLKKTIGQKPKKRAVPKPQVRIVPSTVMFYVYASVVLNLYNDLYQIYLSFQNTNQTPARNLKGYVSTGHADSPATIVVGRAHRQTVVQPTGAAPRVVTNVALFKKNMKMDEDLTGKHLSFIRSRW